MKLSRPANTNEKPLRAGVIGYPVKHSLSPLIHRYWLKQYGINGTYDAMEVKPEELEGFIRSMTAEGFSGVNVTLPHKETALPLVDSYGPVERIIGAVNTLWVNPEDGAIDGTNSDYYGFYKNLEQSVDIRPLTGKRAVVLGAGGASNAAIVALAVLLKMPEIVLCNRSREKAEAKAVVLEERLKVIHPAIRLIVCDWKDRDKTLSGASLLVNATSLGMEGQDTLDIDLSLLPQQALVTDIVYRPLMTDLLLQAQIRGNPIVDGLGMLLYQAVLGFHKWFGVEPHVDDALRAHVLAGM